MKPHLEPQPHLTPAQHAAFLAANEMASTWQRRPDYAAIRDYCALIVPGAVEAVVEQGEREEAA